MPADDVLKAQAQQRFGQFAQGYVESKSHAKGEDLDRMLELAQPQPDWLALDVATGGGHTALKFAPSVRRRMSGSSASSSSITRATSRSGSRRIRCASSR
jgi:ubiquinone/menaquinone biosynthesis C-methylase UbiE